jgi:hypothetical protein
VLRQIISNSKLSEHFLALARDLDVLEPKVPEDVYKTHLTGTTIGLGLRLLWVSPWPAAWCLDGVRSSRGIAKHYVLGAKL